MFIATYERGFLGGYGDRIVGMISVYVLADIFGRPFKLLWTKEAIQKHVDYSVWDAADAVMPPYIPTIVMLSHEPHKLVRQLQQDPPPRIFPYEVTKFVLNQDIVRHLYQNPGIHPVLQRMRQQSYKDRMTVAYQSLYTKILVPTEATREKIRQITDGKTDLIGIQIRGGDVYMDARESHQVLTTSELPTILQRIDAHAPKDTMIFLTSDMGDIAYRYAKELWGTRLLLNEEPVQHMDWTGGAEDAAGSWKVYVDNYILAMCTRYIYITRESNYGRVAALAAPHEEIWDLNCRKCAKPELFSKN